MKLLLVAATPYEIQPFIAHLDADKQLKSDVEVLITGVGMVATAFSLGKQLANVKFDLAINAGIAGAFDRSLQLGEVVSIKEDRLVELGAEDKEDFISIDELRFGKSRFQSSFGHPCLNTLKSVSAITVNKVHGNATSIAKISEYINPQIESMEGAAFFYSCEQFNLPCLQIRSISNYVEPRNRNSWNIPWAIKNLNGSLMQIVRELKGSLNQQMPDLLD